MRLVLILLPVLALLASPASLPAAQPTCAPTRTDAEGHTMIRALFNTYRRDPTNLPPRFAARIAEQGVERVICDYIAGMTDRFCIAEHDNLTRL